jgi:hypothetical protein
MNEWVTIKSYWQVYEAEMTKSLLKANGFQCQIKDNFTLLSDPMLNNTIGGAMVQVLIHQAEQAIVLLKEMNIITEKDELDMSIYTLIEQFLTISNVSL